MKTGDYLAGIIIIISISLLWFRTGILESHIDKLAHAYQNLQYQLDVISESKIK